MKGSGYVVADKTSFVVGENKFLLPGDEIPLGAYSIDAMKAFLKKGQIVRKTVASKLPRGAEEIVVVEEIAEEAAPTTRRGRVLAAEGGE